MRDDQVREPEQFMQRCQVASSRNASAPSSRHSGRVLPASRRSAVRVFDGVTRAAAPDFPVVDGEQWIVGDREPHHLEPLRRP